MAGLIQLSDKVEGNFTEDDQHILVQLAQVASVAIENARLYGELRENDRLKDEFLAMLAHELRNPLAPILNALHMLRHPERSEAQSHWALEVAARQGQQLAHLVDDLMDVSRISRGRINLQQAPLDLATVVARALETSRALIDARRHALDVSLPAEPVMVLGDVMRLAQVLLNLLNNAAKYTAEGGSIWLTVESQGNEALLRVRDTGMGIAAEMLPKIFDLFAQVERTLDRSEGGLGIGLTLVRRLVEMHGGKVAAHSDGIGRGSEFIVRLPRLSHTSSGGSATSASVEAATATRKKRILVVDDNRDSAESLAMLLRVMGHDVQTAHDGLEALAAADAYLPDLILLDIGLPGLNGYGVAEEVRSRSTLPEVKIVALTGYGSEEDLRLSAKAGFDAHLVKPVNLESLEQLLANGV